MMQEALHFYHGRSDHRAVFLRAYYIISINAHDAIHERGDYPKQIFFDPAWINRLAGKFSMLYFRSLTTEQRPASAEKAWKLVHDVAQDGRGTVAQDLLLGLNAHINYDLAYGIYLNMQEHGDGSDHLLLPRRKFDHDQVNNLLLRCVPTIQATLTRDYGGEILLISRLLGSLDERITKSGLGHYRERVWWDAISFLCADDNRQIDLVHERLNWESGKLAKRIVAPRRLGRLAPWLAKQMRKRSYVGVAVERAD